MARTRRPKEESALQLYLSSYHEGSELLKRMAKPEKDRFEAIMKQMKQDTRFELSETEYFWLTKSQYFCEFVEASMAEAGPQKTPMAVLKFYESARKEVLDTMRRYRENKQVVNSSIEGLKKAIKDVLDENGELKATPRKDFVTIPREPAEGDQGDGGELHDEGAVRDPEGDRHPADEAVGDG